VRRKPNPWIAVPSLLLGALAAGLGWIVTDISCRVADGAGGFTTCAGWATLVAGVSFAAVTIGTALILVLVYRSLAEWREKKP
jgi:membrane protein implicated in regulation of membrane protease activity